jgi:hypothetical protein
LLPVQSSACERREGWGGVDDVGRGLTGIGRGGGVTCKVGWRQSCGPLMSTWMWDPAHAGSAL